MELSHLYRRHAGDVKPRVEIMVKRLRDVEQAVLDHTGVTLRDLKMLDVGPGQKLYQMRYFACRNDVTAIDLDVIAQGINPIDYLKMARVNGPIRTAKTLGRKLLGSDGRFRRELSAIMNARPPKRLRVLQMDASKMRFPDASFDFVYSFSTFEHLPDPGGVLDEVIRVLKPGGAAYISLHLFTSENGCHDPRIFSGNRTELPYWSHLRPDHEAKVRCNAYLNKVRLTEWYKLFAEKFPGARVDQLQYANEMLRPELSTLRQQNELGDYSDDELLTVDLAAIWKKPK